MIDFLLRYSFVDPSLSLVRFRQQITLLRIVNIMKVYIERNDSQLELIRYRKKCRLYSRLLLQSDRFNAPISSLAMLAYSLEFGSRCSCISERFEYKPVRSLSFQNGNRGLIIYPSLRFRQSRSTRGHKSMHASMCM